MKKNIILFSILLFTTITSFVQANTTAENTNYVPDKETAIKIAEAIWYPIYGEKIYEEKPFVARLINANIWVVEGTLKTGLGGVAYIEIQKKDCRVLKVSHGK